MLPGVGEAPKLRGHGARGASGAGEAHQEQPQKHHGALPKETSATERKCQMSVTRDILSLLSKGRALVNSLWGDPLAGRSGRALANLLNSQVVIRSLDARTVRALTEIASCLRLALYCTINRKRTSIANHTHTEYCQPPCCLLCFCPSPRGPSGPSSTAAVAMVHSKKCKQKCKPAVYFVVVQGSESCGWVGVIDKSSIQSSQDTVFGM